MAESCGPQGRDACPCCGMQIISENPNQTQNNNQEEDIPDSEEE
jgi:hypothetical protein